MLKNNLIIFNDWLDNNESLKFIILIALVIIASLFLTISFSGINGVLIGISIYALLGLYSLIRVKIINGEWKLDRSKYILPIIGDKVIIINDFLYNTAWLMNTKNYIYNDNIELIKKGDIFNISNIKECGNDWAIELSADNIGVVTFSYLRTKKNWKTQSDLRNDILNKLIK